MMRKQINKVIEKFGAENLLAWLPQEKVREALELVTAKEVAESIGIKYSTIRTHMLNGKMPYPTTTINRRTYFTKQEADEIRSEWGAQKES